MLMQQQENKFAARACGQAVATCHARKHAYSASYYIFKMMKSGGFSEKEIEDEFKCQR